MEILLSISQRGLLLPPSARRSDHPTVIGVGFDIPERLVGDNMPLASSAAIDFARFMQEQLGGRLFPEWAIDHNGHQLVQFSAGPYPATFEVPQQPFR